MEHQPKYQLFFDFTSRDCYEKAHNNKGFLYERGFVKSFRKVRTLDFYNQLKALASEMLMEPISEFNLCITWEFCAIPQIVD